jgi:hypothetical protein
MKVTACNSRHFQQTFIMPWLLFLTCVVAWLWLGCDKGSPPAPAASPSTNGAPGASAQTDLTSTLAELTQALRKFSVERRQVPASLNDLVAAGYIQNMPQPPPGKTFGIDSKNLQVIVK